MVFLEPEVWLTAMGQKRKFNPLTKQLIKHMLGFEEEGSENYVRSEQYIMSNLLYHNYTAVNRHAIQRSIKGLELKFDIHGQKDRSDKLKTLIDKFTSSSCFKDHPEVDIEWAIISLVLLLSNNPTSVTIVQELQPTSTIGKIASTEEEDDIDWVAYLKEDNQSYESSPEDDLSDWSSDEEETMPNLKNIDYDDGNTGRKTALVGGQQNTDVLSLSSVVNKQTEEGRAWLAENCQAPYWLNALDGGKEGVMKLSEWVVMREILWMLLKPSPAVLFYINQEGKLAVNQDITVSSLSKAAFHTYLEKFCEPLNQLKDIDNFFNHLEDQQQEQSEPNVSATVLAYASGLRIWMHEFWSHLTILEEKVRKQEETCTFLWLENELTSWFQKILVIHDVHSSAILDSDGSTQAKAVRLLGVLSEGIVRAVKVDIRTILLRLFLHSLRHYLRLMHHWLYEGLLEDYTNEFIIHRNNEISVFDGNFWSSAFTLEYQELLEASDADSPIKSTLQPLVPILDSLVCVGKTRELLAALLSNDRSSYNNVTPSKLMANDVSKIGALPSLQQHIKKPDFSLEDCIINYIKEAMMTSSLLLQEEDSEEEIKERGGHETLSSHPATEVDFLLYEWQERDPLLLAAFPDIRAPLNNSQNQGKESNIKTNLHHTDKLSQYIESIVADRSKSVIQLLVSGLRPLIHTEQHTLSGQLTQIFKVDHQLSIHFNVLRSVILMEAGDVMHEFYSHLFAKLDAGERMGSNELTLHLQSCLTRLYPDFAHRFSISCDSEEENISEDGGSANIDPAERQRRENLKRLKIGLPDIKIHYEVPWPISLVMTEDIWEQCNKLFAFTLSLKRATYGMERLQFRELASYQSIMSSSLIVESSSKEATNSLNPLQSRIHRLQLLRAWLLYFSHSVHDHFANSVFTPYHVSVEALLASSPPLDTIIKEHEKFLHEICNQSLLTNERRSPLNMILGRIFELMKKLGDVWRRDVGSLSSETLRGLEEEYALCHGFLANFLINLTKSHHIPHMAGLTHAIVSSTPTKVTF